MCCVVVVDYIVVHYDTVQSSDIYTAENSITHLKNVQNHPESVASTLNETHRAKNGIIVGVGNPDN